MNEEALTHGGLSHQKKKNNLQRFQWSVTGYSTNVHWSWSWMPSNCLLLDPDIVKRKTLKHNHAGKWTVLTPRQTLVPVLTEWSASINPVVCLFFMTVNVRFKPTILNQVPDVWFLSRHFTGFPCSTSSALRHFTTLHETSHFRNIFSFSLHSTRQVTEETNMILMFVWPCITDIIM